VALLACSSCCCCRWRFLAAVPPAAELCVALEEFEPVVLSEEFVTVFFKPMADGCADCSADGLWGWEPPVAPEATELVVLTLELLDLLVTFRVPGCGLGSLDLPEPTSGALWRVVELVLLRLALLVALRSAVAGDWDVDDSGSPAPVLLTCEALRCTLDPLLLRLALLVAFCTEGAEDFGFDAWGCPSPVPLPDARD
jgi:hypothetical protein